MGSLAIGISFGQGCSKSVAPKQGVGSLSSSEPDQDADAYKINPEVESVSLVYNKQILDHLVACSGIERASGPTRATWEAKRGTISIDGGVKTLTAPMLMAATSISGDVCRDLIDKEKLEPRLFSGITWTATAEALPNDGVLTDSIKALALSCWQRQPEKLELDTILEATKEQFRSAPVNIEDAYLFLCTSMLSSLETLTL